MTIPNAKICPRCGKVVALTLGVCDHCARLFRTPFEATASDNRTMMFHHLPFLRPNPPARPALPPRRRWPTLPWHLPPLPTIRHLLTRMHWHV